MLSFVLSKAVESNIVNPETSGQSYKQFTLINYDSRVVVTSKLHIFTTIDS